VAVPAYLNALRKSILQLWYVSDEQHPPEVFPGGAYALDHGGSIRRLKRSHAFVNGK
jgi:hypothetical protein